MEKGLNQINIVESSEFLEDSDLLEMTNAGLVPIAVVYDHEARFWKENLKKHQACVELFKKYAEIYDFDFLMTAALAYQESQLFSHNAEIG